MDPITQLKNEILAVFHALEGLLFQSGQNLIHMLVTGITSKVGELMGAVNDIGHKVAAVLGFHSPPKEGPLSDLDSYMPNMMKMYAAGISGNAHLVHSAANSIAMGLRPGGGMFLPGVAFAGASGSSSRGEQHIHLHVGSKEVAHVVVDEITGTLKQNGASRLFR
jgi:hypothetical protein